MCKLYTIKVIPSKTGSSGNFFILKSRLEGYAIGITKGIFWMRINSFLLWEIISPEEAISQLSNKQYIKIVEICMRRTGDYQLAERLKKWKGVVIM